MAHPTTTATSGLRALVLHPDPASLRALAWALEARFFSVCTAPDGTRGLALLLEELLALDVLVIDAALPDRDALSFTRLIRQAGGERDLAIVVVAASPTPELRAAFLALGVDAVVDRSEGPDLAVLTAIAAVATRSARAGDGGPARAAPPELELEPFPVRVAPRFSGGWSMLEA